MLPDSPTGVPWTNVSRMPIETVAREFASRVKRNTRYSLRAFARDLDLPVSKLSELLRGKQDLSLKYTLKIAPPLGVPTGGRTH